MKAYLTIPALAAIIAVGACTRHTYMRQDSPSGAMAAAEGIPVNFSISPWHSDGTKSSIDPDIPDRIMDVCAVVLRDEEGTWVPVMEECRYFSDPQRVAISPGEDAPRKILFIANCGGNPLQRILSCGSLDSLADKFKLEYADCVGSFSGTGMPMTAWVDVDGTVEKGLDVNLRRLYSRWIVSVSQDQLRWSDFSVTGLKVHNAPKAVYPFATASMIKSADESAEDADLACSGDLEVLRNGGSVCLYILENVQGELLPANGWQNGKVPERLYQEGLGDYVDNGLLTSITLSASASTPWGDYSNVDFRAYLGNNTLSDFSIEGNSSHHLNIHLTNDMLEQDGWRTEASGRTGASRPFLNIGISSYQNINGACAPKVEITIPDYDRLSRYLGDFAGGIRVEVSGFGQHGAHVNYRNRHEWEGKNSTLLSFGGWLRYEGTLNPGFTDDKGSWRAPYYSNECEVDITDYCTALGRYSSRSADTFTFLLGQEETDDAPHSFAALINPGTSSVYTVYSEEYSFDYRPYAGWYWDWERKEYDGNGNIRLNVDVCLPAETASQIWSIYGYHPEDICHASSTLPDTYPAGREKLYELGYNGVEFSVDGSPLN